MLKTVSSVANALGALNYKGTWNASTNTPALASGVGTQGDYYVVSVDGATDLDGITNWGVGDWAAFNGSVWQRVEGGADGNFVNLDVTGTATLDDVEVGGDLEVTKATGDSSPDPVELKLRTQTNGSSWSLTDPWGVIDFYSDDSSASGPKSQAQIQAIATNTNGGNSGLDFKLYNTTASQLESYLKISNGGSNALRHVDITGAGGLYLTGGGNVIMNSGAGIDFSATSGTGTSELFDDYEEGTWTPNFSGSGGQAVTESSIDCTYVKIGKLVTIKMSVTITTAYNEGSYMGLAGLPFSVSEMGDTVVYSSNDSDFLRIIPAGSGMRLYIALNNTSSTLSAQIMYEV